MTQISADSAILVIDVQKAFFRAATRPHESALVVSRINRVTAAARTSGLPVFMVQHEEAESVVAFSESWQLDPDLQVDPGDIIIRKTTCDAFYGTTLEAELGARRAGSLVLTGYATEFCLDSTLRAALSKEFNVFVVADAHTTNNSPVLNARLTIDFHNWAWANCIAARPVVVAPVADLEFPNSVQR